MRTSLFLLALIIGLFIGRYTPLYECSAALFTYENVNSLIIVNDTQGNEAILQETNNYDIEIEKALIEFTPKPVELLTHMLDTLSTYTLDYTIDDSRYIKSSSSTEICFENFAISVDKKRTSLFKYTYEALIQADVQLSNGDYQDQFRFDCQSSFMTTGLTTEFFIKTVLTELFVKELHLGVDNYLDNE